MNFKSLALAAFAAMALSSCGGQSAPSKSDATGSTAEITNDVISTIMSRRSVRSYLPQPVGRDTMEVILRCGINAPNGMNRQPWEVRVVDSPEFIDGITAAFLKTEPKTADADGFRNMFRNAPTVVFIAAQEGGKLDCGLMGENMILAAWSMGIGSCCLGGPVAFLKSDDAKPWLDRLGFSEGYELLYAIGFGYPAEKPEAKPRDASKVAFVD